MGTANNIVGDFAGLVAIAILSRSIKAT